MDNDVYGHVNNVVYYSYFDTLVNRFLIEAGLDIHRGPAIGLAVESQCRFHKAVAFPEQIDGGLRVSHLGRSSVRYEIGLFRQGDDDAAADGYFVHVFVERETRRPIDIPGQILTQLQKILRGSGTRSG
jgi:acyl-CoA thioester hydrolase